MAEHERKDLREFFLSRSGLVLVAYPDVCAEIGDDHALYAAHVPVPVPRFGPMIVGSPG